MPKSRDNVAELFSKRGLTATLHLLTVVFHWFESACEDRKKTAER